MPLVRLIQSEVEDAPGIPARPGGRAASQLVTMWSAGIVERAIETAALGILTSIDPNAARAARSSVVRSLTVAGPCDEMAGGANRAGRCRT
jgi:hypothetical protein